MQDNNGRTSKGMGKGSSVSAFLAVKDLSLAQVLMLRVLQVGPQQARATTVRAVGIGGSHAIAGLLLLGKTLVFDIYASM